MMQPLPKRTNDISVTEEVIKDLRRREQKGIETYGDTLRPHNGRDAMLDLYEELLDATQYIKQIMLERKNHAKLIHKLDNGIPLTDEERKYLIDILSTQITNAC